MYDLVSLKTGDVASEDILRDLLNAAESGKQMITNLVKKTTSYKEHTSTTASPRENRKYSQASTAQMLSLKNSERSVSSLTGIFSAASLYPWRVAEWSDG